MPIYVLVRDSRGVVIDLEVREKSFTEIKTYKQLYTAVSPILSAIKKGTQLPTGKNDATSSAQFAIASSDVLSDEKKKDLLRIINQAKATDPIITEKKDFSAEPLSNLAEYFIGVAVGGGAQNAGPVLKFTDPGNGQLLTFQKQS